MRTRQPGSGVLDTTFRISVILKGLDGVLEIVGGLLLLVVAPAQIGAITRFLTQHELSEDPTDPVANGLRQLAAGISVSGSLFAAVYLLLHGLVKVVLVWAVLRDRLWAYPWMIGFLLVFIGYQSYQLTMAFSWGIVALTVFDVFVVFLTGREYANHRTRRADRERDAV